MKKTNCFKHIKPLVVKEYSGFFPKKGEIEFAKKHHYTVIRDIAVTGDAPKDIIRHYEYKKATKTNYRNWPIYIAKLGHKHYPMESITEQLISDIGREYGFYLAKSKLCWIGGQIRFLSQYFLDWKKEELLHGANMYAGFLNNDEKFVDDIEKSKMTQDFFTIKFTKTAIDYFFPKESEELFRNFMRMLFFDALVGNNDRHVYNWGVIKGIFGEKAASFAPIYDSARGLLWNEKESRLEQILKNKQKKESFIQRYCEKSMPKIGLENKKNQVNHFELITEYIDYFSKDELVCKILKNSHIKSIEQMLNLKYLKLLSDNRRKLIIDILYYRYNRVKNILNLQ